MTTHRLVIDDFDDDDSFVLFAIHSTIEDYRLAYILNKNLNLKLKRKPKDLDCQKANYSIFEWKNINQLITWNLVSNICKIKEQVHNNSTSLFNNQSHIITTYYLVPEYKTANYFLKINYQTNFFKEKKIVNALLSIPQIATAYSIQLENLKIKTNLIFS